MNTEDTISELMRLARECAHKQADAANWHGLESALRTALAQVEAAKAIHYPECWDKAAYPTLESALAEMYAAFRCTCDECPQATTQVPQEIAWLVEYDGKMLRAVTGDDMQTECIQYLRVSSAGEHGEQELSLHHDANKALRFARKEDAEAAMLLYAPKRPGDFCNIGNHLSAKEHMWPGEVRALGVISEPKAGEGEKPIDENTAIRRMVDRFLRWPLPKTFSPDCGISFDGRGSDAQGCERTWPIGTNLLDAEQAREMFEYALASCGLAPEGWECTRAAGHAGPCAAVKQPPANAQKPRAWHWQHVLNTTGEVVKQGVSLSVVAPTNNTFWDGTTSTIVHPLYASPPALQAPAMPDASKLKRYDYGYTSDEWGMGRSLGRIAKSDGPFVLYDDVCAMLSALQQPKEPKA